MDGGHIDTSSCLLNTRMAVYTLVGIRTQDRQLRSDCTHFSVSAMEASIQMTFKDLIVGQICDKR